MTTTALAKGDFEFAIETLITTISSVAAIEDFATTISCGCPDAAGTAVADATATGN